MRLREENLLYGYGVSYLPSGLSVSNTGVISGQLGTAQTQEQTYTFTVQDQQQESKNISIVLAVVTGAKVSVVVPKKMLTKDTSITQGNSL
ncbi:putative Ig domain-containing protein [Chlamydia suis]|uniref:putative Ig domain-containing protein n=1 Tax=Chlamydia suis TaxID=83559 RepID=UPI002B38C8B0|nr:putative Ig domain-containing protein [Chlamydia suis]MEB2694212.1 putative Ig domain-containing protein [Chlamydia suis]